MLSILIPVYNYNITKLVTDLHTQARESFVDFEIIVIEDGSNEYLAENKEIEKLENCYYEVCNRNIGRSAARNRLADKAKYKHLLFLDCDAEVNSPYFIEKYESFCREDCIVIGGTEYDPDENNAAYSLRLKYGRKREARHANERDKNNFSTFNFLISKEIFNRVRFDETLKSYGHEDMIFGHELKRLNYEFIQIENPLLHKGLDKNADYLQKTETATKNLLLMYNSGKYPFLTEESRLLARYVLLKKNHLIPLFSGFYNAFGNLLKHHLTCKNPSLIIFDLYKLLYISHIAHK